MVNIDAALAAAPVVAPNGVDVSGTVRDELGTSASATTSNLYDTPADPRDAKEVVAPTISNRAGQYNFTELDRIGGETEFKIVVQAARVPVRTATSPVARTWSGDKLGYETATAITAAPARPRLHPAGRRWCQRSVTSEAGGVPVRERLRRRSTTATSAGFGGAGVEIDGTYDDCARCGPARTPSSSVATTTSPSGGRTRSPRTRRPSRSSPGQVTTGISAALSKDVKAIERPEVDGNAWVGKTLSLDPGRWNTQADSKFTYEWLAGTTVVATGRRSR